MTTVIYNGDHAEFEREHANTKPEDRPDWPLSSFDAVDWAKAFCKIATNLGYKNAEGQPVDEGWMVGWFANSLMRGFDEHANRLALATPPAPTPSAGRALPANRIWFDTEFIEDGTTIDLISIGMVRSDGATYYAETDQWIPGKASQWVKDNVIVHLKGGDCTKPRDVIAREIVEFAGEKPEFWAYYADYDWVALCQLFGTMMQLPDGWPKFCRDIKQRAVDLGNPKLPEQTSTEHHALADALWNKETWDFLALLPDAAAIRAAAFEEADRFVGALWSDLFNKDMVKAEGAYLFDKWRAQIRAAAIRAAGEK